LRATTAAGFFAIVSRGVIAVSRRRPTTGREGLVGAEGVARSELNPAGRVFVPVSPPGKVSRLGYSAASYSPLPYLLPAAVVAAGAVVVEGD